MAHVFISYSRRDADFVHRLYDALEAEGREVWIDWEDIPPSDKWLARIHAAIDEAEAVLFVISPDSAASDVCGQELDYAVRQHKRIIPLLHREPNGALRPELAEINWIFARDSDPLATACQMLIGAIDTDLDWVRAHTRLLVRAVEWDREGRDASYTLRGSDLIGFEDWAAQAPDKEPKPTVLQSEYLLASRRAVTRRQRIAWASVAAGLVIAATLGTVALFISRERDRQAEIASARQLLSRAEALRDVSPKDLHAHSQHQRSLRAATKALAALNRLGAPTLDADQSVRKSYAELEKWHDTDLGTKGIESSAFDARGRRFAYYTTRGEIVVTDTDTGGIEATCKRKPGKSVALKFGLAISGNGRRVAMHTYGGTNVKAWNRISIWSMQDCKILLSEALQDDQRDAVKGLHLNDKGSVLLMQTRRGLLRWAIDEGTRRRLDIATRARLFAGAPDGRRYATYERLRGKRTGWIRIRNADSATVERDWEVAGHVSGLFWGPAGILVHGEQTRLYSTTGELLLSRHIDGSGVVLSPDGRLFAARIGESTIEVHEANSDAPVARSVRQANFKNIAFTADSRALTAVSTYRFDIGRWHFSQSGPYALLEGVGGADRLQFSEDSSELRAIGIQGAAVWRMPRQASYATPVAGDRTLSTTVRHQLPSSAKYPKRDGDRLVLAEAISLSGRKALIVARGITRAGYRRTLEVWEAGKKLAERKYEAVYGDNREGFLQFAGHGRFLVVGNRAGLEMVDASTLTPVAMLYHTGATLVAAQADGKRAVTMDAKRSMRVWDVASSVEIARLTADHSATALALSNDGRWLAQLNPGGRIELWAIAPKDLIVQVCRWLSDPCP